MTGALAPQALAAAQEKRRGAARAGALRPGALAGAIATAIAVSALAIVQWHELLTTLQGGRSFCAVNEVLNCAFVWESDFAKGIQRTTHVPVAGWGLVWGLIALFSSVHLGIRDRKGSRITSAITAVEITALVGLVVAVLLAAVSASLGVYCLTCMGTYLLVALFAAFTFRLRGSSAPKERDLSGGAFIAIAGVFFAYLAVLYPGYATPVDRSTAIERVASSSSDPLAAYLAGLPDHVKRSVRSGLEAYREADAIPSRWPARQRFGSERAPVQIVEFSDIRCTHCKAFAGALHQLEKSAPPGSFAIELRQFPLDGRCNHEVDKEMVDPSGVRCAGARALICLEGKPGFREAQDTMFKEQHALTIDRVLEIASSAGRIEKVALQGCMHSKETAAKLNDDIAAAVAYNLEGTPLIVLNGRSTPNSPELIYALILSRGDVRAEGWRVLGAD